ncbi:MAG TPA: amidohydrolase family protein, partial [Candidatus Limnocylindrales bacterium]|nr:amidohydrolase family protein [Candidatus Limnocylindrales bacterium]
MRIEADGTVGWIRPRGEADLGGADVLDAGGATIVPALVDCHSHLTMPGGSRWIERGADPPDRLREVARHNARRLVAAGILWARDVGAPPVEDPATGRRRAISLDVREELGGKPGQPYIRVAGTWIAKTGYISLAVDAADGEELRRAALAQLDSGTDFVKVMLDAPAGSQDAPFSADELRAAVEAVHARGARITAHSTYLAGARVAAAAGVDSIEHGMELDDDIARTMARSGVALVSTLSVLASWEGFGHTTDLPRFTSAEGRARIAARREGAFAAVAAAKRAGVAIATGSDFGGGSVRAGHLAWE